MLESWHKIIKIFADGGYRGQLIETIKIKFRIDLEIIKRDELDTFKILPKRWIVKGHLRGMIQIDETKKL